MARITQKQLIESLKQMKEIKPRKEWAVLLKSQILTGREIKVQEQPAQFAGFVNAVLRLRSGQIFARKFAYAFAVVLFLIVGVFGFAQRTVPGDLLFPVKKISEQSQATLTGQTGLKQDVATLNSRINDLVQVAKQGRTDNIPSAISEVNADVSQLVKNLKNNPVKDSQTIKEIASSLKTLADVPGTDLSGNSDVKDLYQTIVQSQLADLQKTTLTDGQEIALTEAEDLYNQGKYADALEKILLINDTNNNKI